MKIRIASVASILLLTASAALAQNATPQKQDTPADKDDAKYGAALSVFGGGITGSAGTGGAFGWSIDWRVTRRITVEGSGWWTDEPSVDGFSALIGPRFDLGRVRRTIPFISTEVGLYHAAVDASTGNVPSYYASRMDPLLRRDSFTDFAMGVGAGVDFALKRRVSLRPQVRLLLVTDGSDTRPLMLFGVHLSYNFIAKPREP
jgi:opacity protein-like surface antigen